MTRLAETEIWKPKEYVDFKKVHTQHKMMVAMVVDVFVSLDNRGI